MAPNSSNWDIARIRMQHRRDAAELTLKAVDQARVHLGKMLQLVDPMEFDHSKLQAAFDHLTVAQGALEMIETDAQQNAEWWDEEMDALEKEQLSWVYFIGDAGTSTVKIGYSKSVDQRLAQLQTATTSELQLLGRIVGGPRLEKQLHARFAALRMKGEWFKLGPELVQYLQEQFVRQGTP